MFLSIFEAVNRLEVITKQRCNEITLLHYIWNGYLDLYIQTSADQKIDIVSIGYNGFIYDDDWFVYNLKENYDGLLKVQLSELKASELLRVFESEDHKIKIDLVSIDQHPNNLYSFLTRKPNSSMSIRIKKLYENGFDELIEVCEINESLGLGYFFNKFQFFIDEYQIKNLVSNTPLNSGKLGIDIKNQRQDTLKEVILWLAGHIYTRDKTLTKERLAMNTIEHLQKNIDKLNAKKEKLNIKGEIVLPKWETVRRWADLSTVMDRIKEGEKS